MTKGTEYNSPANCTPFMTFPSYIWEQQKVYFSWASKTFDNNKGDYNTSWLTHTWIKNFHSKMLTTGDVFSIVAI